MECPAVLVPDSSFRKQVEALSGQTVSACFQCEKCTNGCPLTFVMDIPPHKLLRHLQFGLKDQVLKSDTIWVCASCEVCTTRCPNGIDIAHLMDSLRQLALQEGVEVAQHKVPEFHSSFLASVRRWGRVHEAEMATSYMLKAAGLSEIPKQGSLGWEMLKKGKLKILPHLHRDDRFRKLFKNIKQLK